MRIFNLGKKKTNRPKKRSKMTMAEKRKAMAEERLMARAKTDPIAESALILRETGVDIPPINEIKQEEKRMDEKITKMAFDAIEADDDLKKQAIAVKIGHLLGSDSRDEHEAEGLFYPPEGERGPLDTIREYRELEREFGSRTGAFNFLKNPDLLAQLLITLRGIFSSVAGGAATGTGNEESKTIVVEIDGQLIEMSPQVYEIYKAQREQLRLAQSKLRQLTDGEIPDAETEGQLDSKDGMSRIPTAEAEAEEASIAPFVSGKQPDVGQATDKEAKPEEFDIGELISFAEEIANAMEGTPQQFAEDLVASAKGGNQDVQIPLLFLSTVTYDQLMASAKPYAQTEGLLQYISKLTDNKEWVEEALECIRKLVA